MALGMAKVAGKDTAHYISRMEEEALEAVLANTSAYLPPGVFPCRKDGTLVPL